MSLMIKINKNFEFSCGAVKVNKVLKSQIVSQSLKQTISLNLLSV
jgi:hypothetical protein